MYVWPRTFHHALLQAYVRKPIPQTDGEYLMNKWINMHNKQFFFNITISIVNALNTTVIIYSHRLNMIQGKCHIKIKQIIFQAMNYLSTVVCVRLHICVSIYRSNNVTILPMYFQKSGLSGEEKYIVKTFMSSNTRIIFCTTPNAKPTKSTEDKYKHKPIIIIIPTTIKKSST